MTLWVAGKFSILNAWSKEIWPGHMRDKWEQQEQTKRKIQVAPNCGLFAELGACSKLSPILRCSQFASPFSTIFTFIPCNLASLCSENLALGFNALCSLMEFPTPCFFEHV